MTKFCTKCGAQVPLEASFCSACGTPARPPVEATDAPPGTPARSSNTALKVVLVVVGLLVVFGAVIVGGLFYAGMRIKRAAEQVEREYGVNGRGARLPAARRVDVCSLLTQEEASSTIGERVLDVTSSGNTCSYTTKTERRRFTVEVRWRNGRSSLAMMKKIMPSGTLGFESVSGVGDSAMIGPLNSVLIFTRNDTSVTINLHDFEHTREQGIQLAKLIDSHLQF